MRRSVAALILGAASLGAQDFSKLPDWAAVEAQAAARETAPADCDAWVLLDRTSISYTGSGEILRRRQRVVAIKTELGTREAIYILHGDGGKASKVKRLKGWNLRASGELVKLDSDSVVSQNDVGNEEFSTGTLTGAGLERVEKGSIVAFESLEQLKSPLGPVDGVFLLEAHPVRKWELEGVKRGGMFDSQNLDSVAVKFDTKFLEPWGVKLEPTGEGFRAQNLPALPKDESASPSGLNMVPRVMIRFLDPAHPTAAMWGRWDGVAQWTSGLYEPKSQLGTSPATGAGLEGLQSLWAWMGRSLTYKAFYLSPERGWVPEGADEVFRKKYGDCKDLSCFFMAGAKKAGFNAVPVLARIGASEIEADSVVYPAFNHVIAGIQLSQPSGLPGEIVLPQGRFILVDATDPLTPLGLLSSAHRGRRVMFCFKDKAEWIQVPDAAIQMPLVDFKLEGEGDDQGRLVGTIRIQEHGDAWGLRNVALHAGARGVRELLLERIFDLPPTGTLEVVTVGNPLELAKPFSVELKVAHPSGFRRNGAEWELAPLGFPGVPGAIQKPGKPRRTPVQALRTSALNYQATVKAPRALQPLIGDKEGASPFRKMTWKASAAPGQGGTTVLTLSLQHAYVPVRFGFEDREKGVVEWKKDRSFWKTFMEEALAFKGAE